MTARSLGLLESGTGAAGPDLSHHPAPGRGWGLSVPWSCYGHCSQGCGCWPLCEGLGSYILCPSCHLTIPEP